MPWLQKGAQGTTIIATQGSSICSYQIQKLVDGETLDSFASSELKGHKDDIVRFIKHGTQIYSASMDRTVRVWNVVKQKRKCMAVLQGHHRGVYSVDANRDVIVSGSRDQTIKVSLCPYAVYEGGGEGAAGQFGKILVRCTNVQAAWLLKNILCLLAQNRVQNVPAIKNWM